MRNLKFSLCSLLLALIVHAQAQEELTQNMTWNDSARIMIRNLKDGALVVRLQSSSIAVAKLIQQGNNSWANDVKSQQREKNLEIVQSFHSSFTFCKVYFFYADSTDALLSGERSGFFLDDSLNINPSITLKEDFFMIAEEGNPHRQIKFDATQPQRELSEPSYTNGSIVVYDQELNLLKDPFPYYAQEPFPQTFTSSNWKSKVISLDKKMQAFYKKSMK